MLKKSLWFVVSISLVFLLVACGGDNTEGTAEDVVAKVNDQEVLASEYKEIFSRYEMMYAGQGLDLTSEENQEILAMIEEQAMNDVINTVLLVQAAQNDNLEVTAEEVEENINTIRAQFEDEAEFESQLELAGYTLESLENEIRMNLMIDKYLASQLTNISVTDEEVEEMFTIYEAQSEEEIDIEEYRTMIEQELTMQKEQEAVANIIEQLKAESTIEIF